MELKRHFWSFQDVRHAEVCTMQAELYSVGRRQSLVGFK